MDNKVTCPHCHEAFDLGGEAAERIRAQVRTKAFEAELESRLQAERARMAAESERAVESIRDQMDKEAIRHEGDRQALMSEISRLKSEAGHAESLHAQALENARLSIAAENQERIARLEADLAAKDREVEYYRDLKARMSTKMIGETLEQHCESEFNKIRMAAFPRAEFHKDNEISASGSKGDYIFREMDGPDEVVSIMFEMKNDMDTTSTRKKNEHFFKELDKDRREKGCEWAVLVSLLEPDSELYNQGIVDVSWAYPKMYVIRPQFFVPLISLLRNAGLSALDAKRELSRVRRENLDMSTFRGNLDKVKDAVSYSSEQSAKRNAEAVQSIDKAIQRLEAAKDILLAGGKHLAQIDKKLSGLTVEKLCSGAPSVLAAMEGDGPED